MSERPRTFRQEAGTVGYSGNPPPIREKSVGNRLRAGARREDHFHESGVPDRVFRLVLSQVGEPVIVLAGSRRISPDLAVFRGRGGRPRNRRRMAFRYVISPV